MAKSISTLIEDIYAVIDGKGGWDSTIAEYFSGTIGEVVHSRLNPEDSQERGTLRMSSLGTPCTRKLWYQVNTPDEGETLRPPTKLKFLYGDMLEALLLSLAHASGHTVEGLQDTLYINGVKGHRDAVIDGITVDVKSASSYGFKKFKEGRLRDDDPFGYISQLSSYVYAGHKKDPDNVNPVVGAFLVINKENGELCLDLHEFSSEIETKEQEVQALKDMVTREIPPDRSFEPEDDGKSGNKKLPMVCSYCQFKQTCWPSLRTFIYSNGPRYLTTVKFTPNVPEV